jgi:hypothetical protein
MATDPPEHSADAADKLEENVKQWLNEQGYPTEFRAANICRRHQFRVWQGFHVRDEKSGVPREIDVVASRDYPSREHVVRIEHVIECKWSKDKPWIVFTSPNARIGATACAAQTIGDLLGSSAMWAIAGDSELHSLDYFYTPERPGFGGRQAFSKGVDHFYSALAAVTELSLLLAHRHDRPNRKLGRIPTNTTLAFPVIVVEGQLFEAFFDEKADDIQLVSRDRVRCHWRGAASWDFITTVDVVTLDHLDEFMKLRSAQIDLLLARLKNARDEIERCSVERSLKKLTVHGGSRGVLGLPELLLELVKLHEAETQNEVPAKKKTRKPSKKK